VDRTVERSKKYVVKELIISLWNNFHSEKKMEYYFTITNLKGIYQKNRDNEAETDYISSNSDNGRG